MSQKIDEPSDGADVVWMVLSLLSLEPAEQLRLLGELPNENCASKEKLARNNASLLLSALEDHHVAWIDEFGSCSAAVQLFELARRMDYRQSRESFLYAEDWNELRRLARLSLEQAGLLRWEFEGEVDMRKYVEVP